MNFSAYTYLLPYCSYISKLSRFFYCKNKHVLLECFAKNFFKSNYIKKSDLFVACRKPVWALGKGFIQNY